MKQLIKLFGYLSFFSLFIATPFTQAKGVDTQIVDRSSSMLFERIEDARPLNSFALEPSKYTLLLGYAYLKDPVTFVTDPGNDVVNVLGTQHNFSFGLAYQHNANLSFILSSAYNMLSSKTNSSVTVENDSGLEDTVLKLKYSLFRKENTAMAIIPELNFATGSNELLSDDSTSFGVSAVYETKMSFMQWVFLLGYKSASGAIFDVPGIKSIDRKQRIRSSFGAYLPMNAKLGFLGEYIRDWNFSGDDALSPSELYLGARYLWSEKTKLFAGLSLGNLMESGRDYYRADIGIKWSLGAASENNSSNDLSPQKSEENEDLAFSEDNDFFSQQNEETFNDFSETSPSVVAEAPVAKTKTGSCRGLKIFGKTNKAQYYFANNGVSVSEKDKNMIALKVAKPIIQHIDKIAEVIVVGHTSALGDPKYNLDLSRRRATMFKNVLVDSGVPSNLISVRGMGESQLLYLGGNPEDSARNRRVVFIVNFKESCM